MINKKQVNKRHLNIEKIKKEMGKRLSLIRMQSGLKRQEDFAEIMDLGQPQLSNLESGKSALSMKDLFKIMQIEIEGKSVSMDWLFTGRGQMLIPKMAKGKNLDNALLNRLSQLDRTRKDGIIKVIELLVSYH